MYVVLISGPHRGWAQKMAKQLVESKFAACVNIIPRVQSIYRWKGKVIKDSESILIVKTKKPRIKNLIKFVKAHHPYEVPEVIALPIVKGYGPYLKWIHKETT